MSMELSSDIYLSLCEVLEDSRGLYLTCTYLYTNCPDKKYWMATGANRMRYWLPKIKTDVSFLDFVGYGNLEMVKYLKSIGATTTSSGIDPLQWAATMGRLEVVKFLLPVGTNITRKHFNTLFPIAAGNGNVEMLKYLKPFNEDIDYNTFTDAIMYAASAGYIDAIKYMVSIGADVTAKNNACLRYACLYGHTEVVKYLTTIGVDATSSQALEYACECGHLETVKYLVSTGVDIAVHGNRSLRIAIMHKHTNVADYLTSIGASLD